jgi:uncharacterized protein (TIGR03118 family)
MGSRPHAQAHRRPASLVAVAVVIVACALLPALARASSPTRYRQTNLVSNIPGLAQVTDPNLVNPWGMAAGPNTPLWVADNGADVATLYTGAVHRTPVSALPLVVNIPDGAPTGQVFNPTNGFVVHSGMSSGPAMFIFASENGDITGWNKNVPPPAPSTQAQPEVHTPNAVYKGLAMASSGGKTYLYATDFHDNRIDVFDSNFSPATLSGNFTDSSLPAGFAPFGIQAFGNKLYVTYALQDADAHDDVRGQGNGFVDVFTSSGHMVKRLISHGALNSPWGLTIAPSGFGSLSHDLLVGNFGNGLINAYDPSTGAFRGTLLGPGRQPIRNDGLWGLRFGNGVTGSPRTLLFTAGIDAESDGLFGEIQAHH